MVCRARLLWGGRTAYDYFGEAVQHAVQAHAWQQAADLIEAEMRTPNQRRWEPATLRQWLEQLPPEVVRTRPRLYFAYASALPPVASSTTVDAWLKAAEARLAASSALLNDTQRVDEASVQDDGNHLLREIATFQAPHTSSCNNGQATQCVRGLSDEEGQVSPVGSQRAQAVQVEALRAQAKPEAVLKRPAAQHTPQQDLLDPLSVRELEVLQLMAQGSTNQEIARALTLANETIKRHVSNIISKLEACNRTQAVMRAYSLGLLSREV